MNYWVYTEEGAVGPYDLAGLAEWVQPEHLLAAEGSSDWVRAAEIPEVAALWAGPVAPADQVATAAPLAPAEPAPLPPEAIDPRLATGGHEKEETEPSGDWFLHSPSGDVDGPMEIARLRERIRSGTVAPDALLRHRNWSQARHLNETRLFDRARGKDDLSEIHWELYEIALTAPDDLLKREYRVRKRDYHPAERGILEEEAKTRGLA